MAHYVDLMGGTTEFVHKDHLGSTRTVTDVAGSVIDSMDYAPFGELLLGGISPTVENWGFETGSSVDWTAFSGVSSSVTPSQSNSGIYSLAQSGATSGGNYQDIGGLISGHSYQVAVWTKSDSSTCP